MREIVVNWKTTLVAVAAGGCGRREQAQEISTPAPINLVERGRYLTTISGCQDCHSPKIMTAQGPMPDSTKAFSGHPQELGVPKFKAALLEQQEWALGNMHFTCWVGPWGVSFAANITPDVETGIGSWPEEMFIQALRNGKHLGSGRPILPPMPWMNLAAATDEDLKAIFAYLKTVKPIHNAVPAPVAPPDMHTLIQ